MNVHVVFNLGNIEERRRERSEGGVRERGGREGEERGSEGGGRGVRGVRERGGRRREWREGARE